MVVTNAVLTLAQVANTINQDFQFTRGVFSLFSAMVKTTAQAKPNIRPSPIWIVTWLQKLS